MRTMNGSSATWLLAALGLAGLAAGPGCGSRAETAVVAADSTLVYPALEPQEVTASIAFGRDIGKKSGKLLGAGRSFTQKPDGRVIAVIGLENRGRAARDLMLHLVWLDPHGECFYKKRIDLAAGDSTSTLRSSIGVAPDKREPGRYTFQVYLFRELIAEKTFDLRREGDGELPLGRRDDARRAAGSPPG
jgi:hypothetical protein